jgi:hypothetical protein
VRLPLGTSLTVAAAVLAACAHVPAEDVTTRDDAAHEATAPTTTWPPLLDRVWDVEGVVRTADPLVFELRLANLPPEGRPPPCAVQIEASYEAISSDPGVTVSVSTGEPEFDLAFPGCELGERVVTLHAIQAPPMDRYVRTAGPNGDRHWYPREDGSLTRCDLLGCDPGTGQPPAPPGCNAVLVDAVRAGDVPRHSGIDVRACEGEWAVVDIDIGASACPVTGDASPNPCAGQRLDRVYYRLVDGVWRFLAYDEGPGCGEIPEQVPDFPVALCEGLPELP